MKKIKFFKRTAGLVLAAASTTLVSCTTPSSQEAIAPEVEAKPISIISSDECAHVFHKDLAYNVADGASLYVCDTCGKSYLDFNFDLDNDTIDEIESISEYIGTVLPEARFAFSLPKGTYINLGNSTISFERAVVNYSCEGNKLTLAAHVKYTIQANEEGESEAQPEAHELKVLVRGDKIKASYDEVTFDGTVNKFLEKALGEENPIVELLNKDELLKNIKDLHKTINNINDAIDTINENQEIISKLINDIATKISSKMAVEFDPLNEFFAEPVTNEDGSVTYTLKDDSLSAFLTKVGEMTLDDLVEFFFDDAATVEDVLTLAKKLPDKTIGEIVDMVVTYASTTENPEETYNSIMDIILAVSKIDIESELEVNEDTLLSALMGETAVESYNDMLDAIEEFVLGHKEEGSTEYVDAYRVVDVVNMLTDGAYTQVVEITESLECLVSLEFTLKDDVLQALSLAITDTPYGDFAYTLAAGVTTIKLSAGETTIAKVVYDSENVIKAIEFNYPGYTLNYANTEEGESLSFVKSIEEDEEVYEIINFTMDDENINFDMNGYFEEANEFTTQYNLTAKYSYDGTIFDFLKNVKYEDITEAHFDKYVPYFTIDNTFENNTISVTTKTKVGYTPELSVDFKDNKLTVSEYDIRNYEEVTTYDSKPDGSLTYKRLSSKIINKPFLNKQYTLEFNEEDGHVFTYKNYDTWLSYNHYNQIGETENWEYRATYYSLLEDDFTFKPSTLEFSFKEYDYEGGVQFVDWYVENKMIDEENNYLLHGEYGILQLNAKYAMSLESGNMFFKFDESTLVVDDSDDNEVYSVHITNNEDTVDFDVIYRDEYSHLMQSDNLFASYDKTNRTLSLYEKIDEENVLLAEVGFSYDEDGNFTCSYSDKFFIYDLDYRSILYRAAANPETKIEVSGANDKDNSIYTVNASYAGYYFNEGSFHANESVALSCAYDYANSKVTVYYNAVKLGEFALTNDEDSFIIELQSDILKRYIGQEYIVINYVKDGNVARFSTQLSMITILLEMDTTSDDAVVSIVGQNVGMEIPEDLRVDFVVGQDKVVVRGLDNLIGILPANVEVDWSSKSFMIDVDTLIHGGIVFNLESNEPILTDDMFEGVDFTTESE